MTANDIIRLLNNSHPASQVIFRISSTNNETEILDVKNGDTPNRMTIITLSRPKRTIKYY